MAFTPEDALKTRFEIVKSFGETAKNYIQISSAGLALPLLFTMDRLLWLRRAVSLQ